MWLWLCEELRSRGTLLQLSSPSCRTLWTSSPGSPGSSSGSSSRVSTNLPTNRATASSTRRCVRGSALRSVRVCTNERVLTRFFPFSVLCLFLFLVSAAPRCFLAFRAASQPQGNFVAQVRGGWSPEPEPPGLDQEILAHLTPSSGQIGRKHCAVSPRLFINRRSGVRSKN